MAVDYRKDRRKWGFRKTYRGEVIAERYYWPTRAAAFRAYHQFMCIEYPDLRDAAIFVQAAFSIDRLRLILVGASDAELRDLIRIPKLLRLMAGELKRKNRQRKMMLSLFDKEICKGAGPAGFKSHGFRKMK